MHTGSSMKEYEQSPEYAVAYEYLINSRTFSAREYDPKDVKLAMYGTGERYGHKEVDYEKNAIMEFRLNMFSRLRVTCHQKDGEWFVCPECTEFQ